MEFTYTIRQFVLNSGFRENMFRAVLVHQFISRPDDLLRLFTSDTEYNVKTLLHDQEHYSIFQFVHIVGYTYVLFKTMQNKTINKAKNIIT